MLLCEFHGKTIALKSIDLSKALPLYVIEEMQKKVKFYKDLANIQGMTIVSTSLSEQKIKKWHKTRLLRD
ncbi:10893_t:CDS:2 [Funneliformis geosporum]|uniref:10893_t:CDS:1 n=1 Tax=Funneliformis geosporum TaxID=1117311 RepID=A0A9W4SL80_9GLOM|nr:10893_t:CDS:2 [Funneliformis geosporum]